MQKKIPFLMIIGLLVLLLLPMAVHAENPAPILTIQPVEESYDYSDVVTVDAAVTWPDGSSEGLSDLYPDPVLAATLLTSEGDIVSGFIVQSYNGLGHDFNFPLSSDEMEAGYYKVRVESTVENLQAETDVFYYTADRTNAPDPMQCQVKISINTPIWGLNEYFKISAYVTNAQGEPVKGVKVGFNVLYPDMNNAYFYEDYDYLYNTTNEDGTCAIGSRRNEETSFQAGQYLAHVFIVDGTASDTAPFEFVKEDHATHHLIRHDRVEPTYTTTGTEEYWECRVCRKLFSDSEGKNEISEPVVIPMLTPPAEPEIPTVPEPEIPTNPEPELPTGPYEDPNGSGSYDIGTDGYATFTKPAGSAASVTVPDTITVSGRSLPVTAIADKAFQKNSKLTAVTIGKNVKTIGKNAFNGCSKLKTVKGAKGVTAIRDSAFAGCSALKTVPAFDSLQTIGANAFKGCKAMTKFTLAKNVKSIGKNAFSGCAALKTITVKTEKLTTKNVGASAFKGISKKATFKCPKKKLKEYKKLFVKKGAPKTAKFK